MSFTIKPLTNPVGCNVDFGVEVHGLTVEGLSGELFE
jgi:hypothetical protein